MTDHVFETRSAGTACEGVRDQYADGKVAQVYELFIGDRKSRTENYRKFLIGLLKQKGCKRILDIACGTGIDSIMLLEEGFDVVSTDASDKMLKYALQTRWDRRKEPAFDKWTIQEANWVTLYDDIEHLVKDGFDAIICLGSSFAHLLDAYGDQREHLQAFRNFEKCLKPGGYLLIDHRNYESVLEKGKTTTHCIYYNSKHLTDTKTQVLYTGGKPTMVIRDYYMDISSMNGKSNGKDKAVSEFRLSFYPHRLEDFNKMLMTAFGNSAPHQIFGDFKNLNEIECPNFYIHLIQRIRK